MTAKDTLQSLVSNMYQRNQEYAALLAAAGNYTKAGIVRAECESYARQSQELWRELK